MTSITLNSTLSGESIVFEIVDANSQLVECSITLNVRLYSDNQKQFSTIQFQRFKIPITRLQKLRSKLLQWLDSQDAGLVGFKGLFPLVKERTVRFEIDFNDRPDIISSNDKSTVTARYDFGMARGEFSFVTDQSCLRLFASDLNLQTP